MRARGDLGCRVAHELAGAESDGGRAGAGGQGRKGVVAVGAPSRLRVVGDLAGRLRALGGRAQRHELGAGRFDGVLRGGRARLGRQRGLGRLRRALAGGQLGGACRCPFGRGQRRAHADTARDGARRAHAGHHAGRRFGDAAEDGTGVLDRLDDRIDEAVGVGHLVVGRLLAVGQVFAEEIVGRLRVVAEGARALADEPARGQTAQANGGRAQIDDALRELDADVAGRAQHARLGRGLLWRGVSQARGERRLVHVRVVQLVHGVDELPVVEAG